MINQNEIEEAAKERFSAWAENYNVEVLNGRPGGGCSYDAIVSWCEPAWIACELAAESRHSEELKKLQEDKAKLVECVKEIARQEQEAGMWKVPTYEAQLAQKALKDIGEEA